MNLAFKSRADEILAAAGCAAGTSGVVAMATDRDHNIYEGAFGRRCVDRPEAMSADTVFALFSTTKAITATAVLQLAEEGRLDLDAPAKIHVPEIDDLKVIDGFDDSGFPILRPPSRDITIRMLMVHSAGLGYEFTNAVYKRLVDDHGHLSVISGAKSALRTPLLFDPGERWEYGSSLDWCGQIVEAITGERLGEVFKARIFEPLGMHDTALALTGSMRDRLATVHSRAPDGSLAPMDFELPEEPEIQMGGHGLYGTVRDYMCFIRMWLNDGAGEGGQVLQPATNGWRRPIIWESTRLDFCRALFPNFAEIWSFFLEFRSHGRSAS